MITLEHREDNEKFLSPDLDPGPGQRIFGVAHFAFLGRAAESGTANVITLPSLFLTDSNPLNPTGLCMAARPRR